MAVLIPILLWCCLMTMWLVVPRLDNRRDHHRSRATATELASRSGFAPATAPRPPWRAAPFHYGDRHDYEQAAQGPLAGRPTLVCAYGCTDNGVTLWSNTLVLTLDRPTAAVEVLHERPYTSPAIAMPTSMAVHPAEDESLDRAAQVRFDTDLPETPDARAIARVLAAAVTGAPERYSLRANGRTLVLWRGGGFRDAASAEACASAALQALDSAVALGLRRADDSAPSALA
ncbi:hypothetical protein [Streptacidiphilus sp. MAP5-3]|uniref:hypothetical protein n=1 Tax=unclassified Streptacidiphilus TaxID=2643834 RepID=UPI0035151427